MWPHAKRIGKKNENQTGGDFPRRKRQLFARFVVFGADGQSARYRTDRPQIRFFGK